MDSKYPDKIEKKEYSKPYYYSSDSNEIWLQNLKKLNKIQK